MQRKDSGYIGRTMLKMATRQEVTRLNIKDIHGCGERGHGWENGKE